MTRKRNGTRSLEGGRKREKVERKKRRRLRRKKGKNKGKGKKGKLVIRNSWKSNQDKTKLTCSRRLMIKFKIILYNLISCTHKLINAITCSSSVTSA